MTIEEKIIKSIINIASIHTGKTILSIDEVDTIYDSKEYPELNKAIDYIIGE